MGDKGTMVRDLLETGVADSALETLATIGVGIAFVDPDFRFVWANEAFHTLLGYDSAALAGKTFLDITHSADVELNRDLVSRAFAGEIPHFLVRKRYVRGDGSVFHGNLIAAFASDSEGHPWSGMAVLTEATVVDPVAERIEQLQRSATAGQLASGLAHDLINATGTIRILADTLRGGGAADDRTWDLLEGAADETVRLARSLVDYAAPHAPADPLAMVSVRTLIDQTRALFRLVIPGRTALDIVHSDEELWVRVEPGEFQQVLLNLLLNARDATPGSDRSVRIQTREHADFAEIAVIDDGVGMDDRQISRIFDPYYSTKGSGGTGLGLTICREIVERNAGHLSVQSTVGQGSIFTIGLPIQHPKQRELG